MSLARPRWGLPLAAIALALPGAWSCSGEIQQSEDAGPAEVDDGSSELACEPAQSGDALVLDGAESYASLEAPQLGLATFTLETWVRRDGRGETAGTGVGGVHVVPLISKGRGEADGDERDCNYAFGFAGDVLAADFEDAASGQNHPVLGGRAIPRGEWHHVAATYDGDTWRLYVDGELDAQQSAGATPRADSVQAFALGTTLNSKGEAQGRLHGLLDEARVWNRALDGDEIREVMHESLEEGDGLVARFAMDGDVVDSVSGSVAAVVGAAFEAGVPLDEGKPPIVVASGFEAGLEDAGKLRVHAIDSDDESLRVQFRLRPLGESDAFSVVVLPDTQYYTHQDRDIEQYFYDQTQWVRDNREAYDILAVIHNGDVVNNADVPYQWTVADKAMSTLEDPEEALPDGVPYGVAVGNHDQFPRRAPGSTSEFNTHFGVDRFAGRAYYGGHLGSRNDNSWFTFSAGSLDFVVVSLEFDEDPDLSVLAWARSIFAMHPESFGVLNTHYVVGKTGGFSAQGRAIYEVLKDIENVQLMTGGHISAEATRSDSHAGHIIHSMLADYQSRENGGNGFLRIWEFSPASDELTVRTYSPTLDKWETDANSEFTLDVDLRGAGGPFDDVGDAAIGANGAVLDLGDLELEPGRYEWYAEISDCAHSVKTEVQRFEVAGK